MKTENLLLLGALGVGAYLLFGNKTASATVTENMQSGQGTGQDQKKVEDQGIKPADIANLNTGWENGTLKRTSQTLAQNMTFTTPDNIIHTGNIVQLSNNAKVAVSVTPAIRDAQGKTAIDRLIEKNKQANSALIKKK